jgi:hypothetical protein
MGASSGARTASRGPEGSIGVDTGFFSVAWANGLYEAVGEDGVAAESPDGLRWSLRATRTANDLFGVAWTGDRLLGLGRGGAILDGGCAAAPREEKSPRRMPRTVTRD